MLMNQPTILTQGDETKTGHLESFEVVEGGIVYGVFVASE